MTDQPPSPPGNYPPPPPPPGGYPPPPGGGYHPPPQVATGYPPPAAAGPALPTEAYTPWLTRVLAWLIDSVPIFIVEGIGWAILMGTQETACISDTSEYNLGQYCATGASTIGQLSIALAGILALAYVVGEYGCRQEKTKTDNAK